MANQKVRVRFAPSPTGALHIGGVRTALFNYLFAKKNNGTFILRIEDTDQTRYVPGAEQYIMESLKWCGIKVDEGIEEGGKFGPYRQSERKPIYRQYAMQLIESGNAYYAFDTPEELDKQRADYESRGETFIYSIKTRGNLRNSLSMPADEVKKLLDSDVHYVIRFKMPEDVDVTEEDLIRGAVTFNTNLLDDKVLFKSDGMPTYHLANIVDDHLMAISHVIRGEEWLPSMPLHVLLYKSFGWEAPRFAHLPLILKPVGKGKLSKRDGDKMGFPVFPLFWTDPFTGETSTGYRESGYFPEAFVNMLALLGWNPGTEQEIFTMEELSLAFSLDRVGKAGSKFNPEKTKWFNHQYMMHRDDNDVAAEFQKTLKEKGINMPTDYVVRVVSMIKDRATFIPEIWNHGYYFFQAPQSYDEKTVKKRWEGNSAQIMTEICDFLKNYSGEWKSEPMKESFSEMATAKEWNFGSVMSAFRLCVVGAPMGTEMFDICELIGRDETIARIQKAVSVLG